MIVPFVTRMKRCEQICFEKKARNGVSFVFFKDAVDKGSDAKTAKCGCHADKKTTDHVGRVVHHEVKAREGDERGKQECRPAVLFATGKEDGAHGSEGHGGVSRGEGAFTFKRRTDVLPKGAKRLVLVGTYARYEGLERKVGDDAANANGKEYGYADFARATK